jgi:hypothetical protein
MSRKIPERNWLLTGSIGVAAALLGLGVLVVVTGVFDPVRGGSLSDINRVGHGLPPNRLSRSSTRRDAPEPGRAHRLGEPLGCAPSRLYGVRSIQVTGTTIYQPHTTFPRTFMSGRRLLSIAHINVKKALLVSSFLNDELRPRSHNQRRKETPIA